MQNKMKYEKENISIKESWLHGSLDTKVTNPSNVQRDPNKKYVSHHEFNLDIARMILCNFEERELRATTEELDQVVNLWIKNVGAQYGLKNPIDIISNRFPLLFQGSLEKFIALNAKLKSKLQDVQHYFQSNLTLDPQDGAMALFILKSYVHGNIAEATLMSSLLMGKLYYDFKLFVVEKESVTNHAKEVLPEVEKYPITKLIVKILNEDPNANTDTLEQRLRNPTKSDKEICVIHSIDRTKNGYIKFSDRDGKNEGKITWRNLTKSFSKYKNKNSVAEHG